MNQTKYTFLLPAYKPNFLAEALESIKEQTYTDFKVIVSDDCSPHDLKSIFEKTCGDDSRFVFRRNEKNMGGKSLVSHWNLLVDICDTEYFIMASDDDVYEPTFMQEIDELVCRYHSVNLFRAKVREIDEHGIEIRQELPTQEYLDPLHFIERMYKTGFISCEANYVYKTKVLKDNNGYVDFPKAWFSDDATHIMMAMAGCCTTQKVAFSYRTSELSISGNRRGKNECIAKLKASYDFFEWMNKFIHQFDTNDELVRSIKEEYKAKVVRNVKDFIYGCPFHYFIRYLIVCPRSLNLNRMRMLFHWFRWRL